MISFGLSPDSLLETFGTVGLFAIVFIESGLLVGFFLPGDSLLFTAGLLASQDELNFPLIVVGCMIAAVAGDQVGYSIGRKAGPRLLARERWFTQRRHVARAERFFARRGGHAVLIARFVPIVRTFVPVMAGIVRMPYRKFVGWNIAGGVLWGGGVTTAGYILGDQVGYTIGRRAGPRLLARERWFTQRRHVLRAERFFARRGGQAANAKRAGVTVSTGRGHWLETE